jgi:hypothetical protein
MKPFYQKLKSFLFFLIFAFIFSCEDKKSTDNSPAGDGDISESVWGQITVQDPKVFAASDVSQATIDLTRQWVKVASDAWGSYGPVELWIVGSDRDAVIAFDAEWCDHRTLMDSKWNTTWDCANGDPYNSGNGWSPFYRYVNDGGAAVSTYRRDYFDYHFMTITMSAKYPGPDEEDYKPVTLHEYFHVYQHAHISDISTNGDRSKRENKNGGEGKPWFAEGGAEYMAQLLYSRQKGVRQGYLKEKLTEKYSTVADYKSYGKKLNQISYNDPVNAYDIGSWFIAYLIHLTSEKAFRVDFYNDLDMLGFNASFIKHFGKDPESLITDFDLFLDKGLVEALKIIP